MELLKAPTNIATSRLLRAWAMGVQEFLGTGPPTSRGQATPAAVPCSKFQATQSLIVLAEYLALSIYPATVSYNNLGILLSSVDNQRRVFQPSGSNSTKETTGRNLSRLYFEAGLEIDPCNAHLLANLGSYWKKEGNYEEAIRFVPSSIGFSRLTPLHRSVRYYQLALGLNPEFTAPRVYLEQTLREIGCVPIYVLDFIPIPFTGKTSRGFGMNRYIRSSTSLDLSPFVILIVPTPSCNIT